MADPEYIEQLVLEEMTGTITPENKAILQQLLQKEPEAKAIWQNIHEQLGNSHFEHIQENLPDMLPAEHLLSEIKKRKRRKLYLVPAGTMVAMIAIMVLIWQVMRPVMQPVTPPTIPSFALKTVVLQLPGKQQVSLGSGPQQVTVDGITVVEKDGMLHLSGGNRSQQATLMVPAGRDYAVQLQDGSEMFINAGTSVRLPLAFGQHREIAINGEAYLKIASDPEKPFRVQLPQGTTVQVLGTAFNVNTYDSSQIQVALTEGAVKMITTSGSLVLQPGITASYHPGEKPVTSTFEQEELLSWREGIYRFRDKPVSAIAPVIERLYGIKVIIDDPAVANMSITNTINKNQPLTSFLQALTHIAPIRYRFEKEGSILHLLP